MADSAPEVVFQPGDLIMLRVQTYHPHSLADGTMCLVVICDDTNVPAWTPSLYVMLPDGGAGWISSLRFVLVARAEEMRHEG